MSSSRFGAKKLTSHCLNIMGPRYRNGPARCGGLAELYGNITSCKSKISGASLLFDRKTYPGWVTTAPHGRRSPARRLWFDEELGFQQSAEDWGNGLRAREGGAPLRR